MNPAMADAHAAQTADAYAAQAATRPLAGFGAGAFPCEGTWAGFRMNEMAAEQALPRIKSAGAVRSSHANGTGGAQAGVAGAAYKTTVVDIVQADWLQLGTHNFIQTARQNPVTPGGVGPHPAREPVPV